MDEQTAAPLGAKERCTRFNNRNTLLSGLLIVALLALEWLSGYVFSYRSRVAWAVMSAVNLGAWLSLFGLSCKRALAAGLLRPVWTLMACASAIWIAGLLIWTYILFAFHGDGQMQPVLANLSNYLFLCWVIPMFAAVSWPVAGAPSRTYLAIEFTQYAIVGALAYFVFTVVNPFTNIPSVLKSDYSPYSLLNIMEYAIDAQIALRFLSLPSCREHVFFRALFFAASFGFVCSRLSDACFAQHWFLGARVLNSGQAWGQVFFLWRFTSHARVEQFAPLGYRRNLRMLVCDVVSPICIAFATIAMGIYVARSYFAVGIGAIVATFVLFATRAMLVEVRQIQTYRALLQARDELEELSLKDPLTGLANRRNFDRTLERECARATVEKRTLSLLLVDLDHFKRVNDCFGHRMGDDVLVRVAAAMRSEASPFGHLVARYGGEEFVAILPDTGLEEAQRLAIRIRDSVRALTIKYDASSAGHLTVSIGVAASSTLHGTVPAVLLENADRALYDAKHKGRDRIECSLV